MENQESHEERPAGSLNSMYADDGYGTTSQPENRPLSMQEPAARNGRRTVMQGAAAVFSRVRFPGGKVGRLIRKFWYVLVVVLILIGAAIAWGVHAASVEASWKRAADFYGRADYANAAKELKGMSVPKTDDRLIVYAQTMLATRQLDRALPAYNALYASKKDPAVKLIIGNIYSEQKKYDEAAKNYNELIAANAGYVQAYVNLATLYRLQGKNEDAIATAKKGVAANPNSVVLHELLISMLLDRKESDDYKKAVENLKTLNPQDPIFEAIGE